MKVTPPVIVGSLAGAAALVIALSTSFLITHPNNQPAEETPQTVAAAESSSTETEISRPAETAGETETGPVLLAEAETAADPGTDNRAFGLGGSSKPGASGSGSSSSGTGASSSGGAASSGKNSGKAASASSKKDELELTVGVNREGPGADARPFYVDTASARDTVLMFYMIGSNLESERGAATNDLKELAAAKTGSHLKVVIEAGGAKNWFSKDIKGTEPARYEMKNGKLQYLESAGSVSMTEKNTVLDFLNFTKKNYPADRYILIFWDHGGGTRGGFGLDEVKRKPSLAISDLADALEASGMKFDIIGFDACLMATLETAYVLEPYADFMIASEEYEPTEGWYYTDAVSQLAADPALDSIEFGITVSTGYLEQAKRTDITLTMLDLRGIPALYTALDKYLAGITTEIRADNDRFRDYSITRDKTKEFCDGEIDQIDLVDFLARNDFEEGKDELALAMGTCIRVFGVGDLPGANGIAMYLPYHEIGYYSKTQRMLRAAGFDKPVESYDYLLSVMSGGQAQKAPRVALNKSGTGVSADDKAWIDADAAASFEYFVVPEELFLTEAGKGFDLVQPVEFWDNITDIQLQCILDTGEEYIDLGLDNVGSITDEGNWHISFDGMWMSLDGIPVCYKPDRIYYGDGDVDIIYTGMIPVLLNGERRAELVVRCDPDDEGMAGIAGKIMGLRFRDDESGTVEKGLRPLTPGDELELVYEVYNHENEYLGQRVIGEPVYVTETHQPELGYTDVMTTELIGNSDLYFWGVLYDIYQRMLSTETLCWM